MMNSTFDVRDALEELANDTPHPSVGLADTALRRARHRRNVARGAAAAALATTVSVVVIAMTPDPAPETSVPPAGSPEASAQDDPPTGQGETNAQPDSASEELDTGGLPLLLIDDSAWEITYSSGVPATSGEMEMSDGSRQLQLNWFPADQFDSKVADRRHSSDVEDQVTVLGREATFFRYMGGSRDFTALWRQGHVTLEARGQGFADRASYQAVLDQLVEVDDDTWIAAMPTDAVAVDERAEVVAEMLADVPTPAGFDRSDVPAGSSVSNRYQLAVNVTQSVLCEWTRRWIGATASGDEAAADRAVAAITSSHDWEVLAEMDEEGSYAEHIRRIVDVIDGSGSTDDLAVDLSVEPPDPDQPLDRYRNAFGCAK